MHEALSPCDTTPWVCSAFLLLFVCACFFFLKSLWLCLFVKPEFCLLVSKRVLNNQVDIGVYFMLAISSTLHLNRHSLQLLLSLI